jgi:hypothetical protein
MAKNKRPAKILDMMSDVMLETLARIDADPSASASTKAEIAYCRTRLSAIMDGEHALQAVNEWIRRSNGGRPPSSNGTILLGNGV